MNVAFIEHRNPRSTSLDHQAAYGDHAGSSLIETSDHGDGALVATRSYDGLDRLASIAIPCRGPAGHGTALRFIEKSSPQERWFPERE